MGIQGVGFGAQGSELRDKVRFMVWSSGFVISCNEKRSARCRTPGLSDSHFPFVLFFSDHLLGVGFAVCGLRRETYQEWRGWGSGMRV